jgi:hypothetical protein
MPVDGPCREGMWIESRDERQCELTSTTSAVREVPSRRRRRASAPLRHLGRNCCHDGYSDCILRRLDINDISLDQAATSDPAHSIDEEAQTERGRDVSANLAVGWSRCDTATDPRKYSRSCKTRRGRLGGESRAKL